MTKKQDKLIDLAVHESSDPDEIISRHQEDISRDIPQSDDSLPDEKNPDINQDEPNVVDEQMTIANLSAG